MIWQPLHVANARQLTEPHDELIGRELASVLRSVAGSFVLIRHRLFCQGTRSVPATFETQLMAQPSNVFLQFGHAAGDLTAVEVFVRGAVRERGRHRTIGVEGAVLPTLADVAGEFRLWSLRPTGCGSRRWLTLVIGRRVCPLAIACKLWTPQGEWYRSCPRSDCGGWKLENRHLWMDGRRWVFRGVGHTSVPTGAWAEYGDALLGLTVETDRRLAGQRGIARGCAAVAAAVDGTICRPSWTRWVQWPAVQMVAIAATWSGTRPQLAAVAPERPVCCRRDGRGIDRDSRLGGRRAVSGGAGAAGGRLSAIGGSTGVGMSEPTGGGRAGGRATRPGDSFRLRTSAARPGPAIRLERLHCRLDDVELRAGKSACSTEHAKATMTSTNPRYARQALFRPLGDDGQRRLQQGTALVCGCGALGSVIANTLVRAGVGRVRLVDRDFLELNNLQRQVLYDEADVAAGLPKAIAAQRKLKQINSEVEIEAIVADVDYRNVERLIQGVDVIVDGTDNFDTRFLLNDAAVRHGVPWIYGGCIGAEGQTMTILPGETACLRCLMRDSPPPGTTPTCDTAGILGPIVNVIASYEACEAMKLLSGRRDAVNRSLNVFDMWDNRVRQIGLETLREARDCPTCDRREFPWLTGQRGGQSAVLCGRNAVQLSFPAEAAMPLSQLAEKLQGVGRVTSNAFLLRLEVDNYRITVFADGRAIVGGTDDVAEAKTVHARYIGS